MAADEWKAGVARTVITPTQQMWMSGYASRSRPAEGTLHDLWAKALVVEDSDGREAILVTLDLVGVDRDTSAAICSKIQQACDVERSQIAIATSHTHTGPVVGTNLRSMYSYDEHQDRLVREYNAWLIDQVTQTVSSAWNNRQDVSLNYAVGTASFAVNRRNNREADVPKLREAGELRGPVDHSVPVLCVKDSSDEIIAIVFGYACHATVLSFYQWSGDWPGFAQIEIEKAYPGATAMFVAGCGADQNPLPRRTVELGEDYGRQMATAVSNVIDNELQVITGEISTEYEEIDLAFADLPERSQIEEDTKSDNKYIASRARLLLKQLDTNGRLSPDVLVSRAGVACWPDIHCIPWWRGCCGLLAASADGE